MFPTTGREFIAGVFNDKLDAKAHTTSRRADLPSITAATTVLSINTTTQGESCPNWGTIVGLDLEYSALYTLAPVAPMYAESNSYCTSRTYAHRAQPHLQITDIICFNNDVYGFTVVAGADASQELISQDATFVSVENTSDTICWNATTRIPEIESSPLVTIGHCRTNGPVSLEVPPGQNASMTFISARFTSVDIDEAASASETPVQLALAAFNKATATQKTLWPEHVAAMTNLNQARIEVAGDSHLAQVINATMHALWTTVRSDVAYSSSPGGLATNSYYGRVARHTFD